MSESQAKEQRPANLTALHRQLEEMAAKRRAAESALDRPKGVQGPALVIRGK
jgi:hypothetical protein